MRHSAAAFLAVILACAAMQAVAGDDRTTAASRTPVEKTFLIPAADGYGVGECLTGSGECGQVVADAWCESQGYASASSFGTAAKDEYTGSIDSAPKAEERPIRITCRD